MNPAIVSNPCAVCGVAVLDVADPTFTDDWLCYWCHCARIGEDHKERFNLMAEAVKLGACYMRAYHEKSPAERARRVDAGKELVFLRGTKTEGSLRFVPILSQITAAPLAWALDHAPGKDVLFDPWGNVRRDLAHACSVLGIPPVTPNDLRRSFAKWLRIGGASPADIAGAMGHTTSRMVERIYGRVEPGELRKLLEQSTGGGGKHLGEPATQTRTPKGPVTDEN